MSRSVKGFSIIWSGRQRVLAERETPPKHKYEFEVSADWGRIVSLHSRSPVDVADGEAEEDAERFDKEAGQAVEEFLRRPRARGQIETVRHGRRGDDPSSKGGLRLMEAEETFVERLERDAIIEEAGKKTLERLYQLVQKGYRPDFDQNFAGAVWLHHPKKNFNHDLLFLYPDGHVVSAGKGDEFRFDRDEDALFQKFLRSVPRPTFWDRTREGRTSIAAWIIIGSVTIGSALLVVATLHFFGFK